ncbi:piggyBac transposable element-derived protein 4-like [Pelobates fuscus]|uniref:piggyBac transposable element-derived protein 4-like n=1 Tax=Pelobates fuscus TaxID=191477 RepID=UPI002FE459A6
MSRRYTAEEAYDILAADSDATDTASESGDETVPDTAGPSVVSAKSLDLAHDAGDWEPLNDFTPDNPLFTGSPGIQLDVTNYSALDFMQQFFGDDILGDIVTKTNLYAVQYLTLDDQSLIARQGSWYPTSVPELKKFGTLTMLMGIIKKKKKNSIRMYWSKNSVCSTPIYSQTMNRSRYEAMLRFLHNSKCPPRDNPQYDNLYKIRPLISHFNRQFGSMYTPQKNICVDESLMNYKGRLGFKQYIPVKRSRYGIKLYKLCESASGYVYTFRVYEGKDSHLDPPGCPDIIGMSGEIVWDLINPLLNKGYHLFIDNYYNSIPLLRILYCFETVACGTIRKTRVGFPKALAQKKLKRGETTALCQDELQALKFKDKKEVFMLTSMHTERTRRVTVCGRQEIRRVPVCIRRYNKHMGGVDLSDQLLQSYLILRKTRAWYKSLAFTLCK